MQSDEYREPSEMLPKRASAPFVLCDTEGCFNPLFTNADGLLRYNEHPDRKWYCNDCSGGVVNR